MNPLDIVTLRRPLRRSARVVSIAVGLLAASASFADVAKRAFDLTSSVGVRMELADGVSYTNNWATVKSALTALKIKNVRAGGSDLGWNTNKQTRVLDLANNVGVKFDYVFGKPDQPLNAMQSAVDWITAHSSFALAIEGPNEWSHTYYDLSTGGYNDDWAQEVADFQVALRNYARDVAGFTGTLVCPSVWKRDLWAYNQLNTLNVENYSSVGNLHYYHDNSYKPTQTGEAVHGANHTYSSQVESMDQALLDSRSLKSPTWVTETGEQHGGGGESGNMVTPTMAAKYLPRLIAEFFNRDAKKIFLFELMDEAAGNYGMLTDTGVQRPAYTSVRNFMTLLDNPGGGSFTPGTLNYSLNGATGISTLLLQKSNGTYYLLLWKDVVSTDADVTQVITLSWTGFTSPAVKIYLPLTSTTAVTSLTNRTQANVTVRDHIVVVEIAQ